MSASVVLDGSGNVSKWLDLSGNDRHFTQTVPGFRPDYLTGDALVFDGVDDRLTCAYTFCNTAPCSVFVVSESSGLVRYGLMGTRHSDASRGFIFNYRGLFENTSYASIGGAKVVASGSIRDLDINSFERVNSTQSQVRSFLNTSSVLTYTGVLVAANQGTILGAEDFMLFGFLNGKIKKVLIIEDAVDAATREKIEGWMAHDCGITANLPIGHPYKNSPPTVF